LNSNLTLTGSKTFRSKSAEYGGGVGALKSTATFIGKSTFEKTSQSNVVEVSLHTPAL